MKKTPLIIGITGSFGSGKSTASDFFTEQGFTRITLSSFIAKELIKAKKEVTRASLQDEGNAMRKKHGSGVLAERALAHIELENVEKVVIDGIRTLGEVEVLYKQPNFVSLAIVADRSVRFERLSAHPHYGMLSPESFGKLDFRDLGVGEKDYGLQTGLSLSLADMFIENNDTKKAFETRLHKVLKEILS